MTSHSVKRPQAHKRSRNGCFTCRDRHIKCDEASPKCQNCETSGRICETGMRLKFVKCNVANIPDKTVKFDAKDILFLDQSLSIHKVFHSNKFHNYKDWLRSHTAEELMLSDMDIDGVAVSKQDLCKLNEPSEPATNLSSKLDKFEYPSSISSYTSSAYSTCDSSKVGTPVADQLAYPSPVSEVIYHKQAFNFADFLYILLSSSPFNGLGSVFGLQHITSIMKHLHSLNLSITSKVSCEGNKLQSYLTINDFNNLVDYVNGLLIIGNYALLDSYVPILVNCLNIAIKSGLVPELLQINFVTRKISNLFCNLLVSGNRFDSHDVLMNVFELLVLDLNRSLISKSKPCFELSSFGSQEFIDKVLSLNLGNDLQFFTVNCFSLLLRLKGLFHSTQYDYSFNFTELMDILENLKKFENNQFLTFYLPQILYGANSLNLSSIRYQSSQSELINTLYLFILTFIESNFFLSQELLIKFREPTLLYAFWQSLETNNRKRYCIAVMNSSPSLFRENGLQFLNCV
ncbi:hypothetical protein WICPIJ_002344 [Wickerhamomyces pijperi]|uniref:Zn(2)-C6 fungal-type domain-containing protein n=1 Tax=Wickerhamomyces pijperi TaxID=599730 RepID=A0A9P8QBP8_WICPI|nr:hypothetical protein WICPIJ_002344 [Wickerhamomyces pijperi]